ncbi:unnamed protein product, partial [Rotaria sp. Silwood1]
RIRLIDIIDLDRKVHRSELQYNIIAIDDNNNNQKLKFHKD